MQYSHGAGQYDRSFNVENSGPATGREARLSPFHGQKPAKPAPAEVIDAEFVHVDEGGNVVDEPAPETGARVSPGEFFRRGRARSGRPSSASASARRSLDSLSPAGFGLLVAVLCLAVFWFSGGHALFR